MEVVLILLAVGLMITGIIGCILPFLPGPPLSFVALLILFFLPESSISNKMILTLGAATVFITLLDFIIPIWGTKKFGGSRQGTWGATIGLILGVFFFPPFGIFIGAFAGAFIGEMMHDSTDSGKAFRAAFGSLVGFAIGTGLKLILCFWMMFYLILEVVRYVR